MVCTALYNNTNNQIRPLCLKFHCVCVYVWCTAGTVGLGEAEALLDNFRKLSHLPAKLKRGQKGRIKIGSLPCPEPLHTHSVHAEWSSLEGAGAAGCGDVEH